MDCIIEEILVAVVTPALFISCLVFCGNDKNGAIRDDK